jgi:hypothetical protein
VLWLATPTHKIACVGIAEAAPNACLFGAGVSMAVSALHIVLPRTEFFFTVTLVTFVTTKFFSVTIVTLLKN